MATQQHWKKIIFSQAWQTISLSLPIILSELAGSIGGFIGTLMIARLGQEALAASALVNTTCMTLMASTWGVLLSVGVLVANAYGAQQHEKIANLTRQGFWLAIFLSIPVTLIMLNATPIFLFLKQPKDTVLLAQHFFTPLAWSILPALFTAVLQQYSVALKHSRIVMICTFLMVLLSTIANYALIFGKWGLPKLGIAGIGWGTTIVNWIILFFVIAYVYAVNELRKYQVFTNWWRIEKSYLWQLLMIGWPIGAMFGVEICGLLTAVLLCGLLGEESLAAYQIAMQCMIMAIMIPWGMAQGTTVLVGHAKGAQDYFKAKQVGYVGILLGFVVMIIIAAFFWIYPQGVVKLFFDYDNHKNLSVIKLLTSMLIVSAIVQLFDGARIMAAGALRGLKDTRISLLVGVISFWVIGTPLGYYLTFSRHLGAVGLWWGSVAGVVIGSFILIARFHQLIAKSTNGSNR